MSQLKRLVRKPDRDAEGYEVSELKAALNRAGFDASDADIEWAWKQHSDDWAASWLMVGSGADTDSEVKYLLQYLEEAATP